MGTSTPWGEAGEEDEVDEGDEAGVEEVDEGDEAGVEEVDEDARFFASSAARTIANLA
jgi:hypothetical protein